MITSILEYLESSASRYPDKTAFADLDAHVHLRNYASGQEELGLPLQNILLREIRCRFLWKKVWIP